MTNNGPEVESPGNAALGRFLREELGVDASMGVASVWTVTAPLWVWRGSGTGPPPKAAWYFLTIDGDAAAEIRAAAGPMGGFGSVKVVAQIGHTRWTTSLFPSREAGGYLLPVKADVRRREGLVADMQTRVTLTLA